MKDLTKGSPLSLILFFAAPILLGNMFQLLYNMADTRIVGTFLGENALAAVGATGSVNNLLVGLIIGMTNGFAILTARRYGAKDRDGVRKSIGSIFILAFITAIIITILGLFCLEPLLRLLNTPDDLINTSIRYFRVILLGTTVTMFYNVCATVLRAVGDSLTPLLFLMLSTFLNVILDLIFVVPLGLGVEGAALATVLAQLISVILCLYVMYSRFYDLWPTRSDFRLELSVAGQLYGTGLSMAMMYCLVNAGSVILQGSINTFGQDIIIAHTAARRLTELFMMVFSALGATMATFTSQNFGARKPDRIRQGLKISFFISLGVWVVIVLITYTVSPYLVYMVTGTKTENIINTAVLYLKVDTLLYWVTAGISILRNSLQGVGDKKTPLISSTIELLGKIAVVILLTPKLGYFGIILAEPIVWVLMVIPLIVQVLRNPSYKDIKA
ncbi:MAG TPA: MATE family efflux transporter [Candidatus Butyricicoccus avistercoris]|uniref:MATE family efflux transporter n=1 Tax=Candidatus Butyricicoccus avistercoris TaxID=2838518 RepID=A0A9D1THW2_9FIRM|nr:MATE family efflux transporter [Candidatus Butyricicoccus avistercoris]